ncbi:MAG: phage tail protein [Methylococcales bacterium]|nr:phage tail protein [Methylococcales bacterium]
MSLFGGAKTKSTVADMVGSMKIQSQGYGNVIPLVYGRARVSPTLCFYSNFAAHPVVETIKTSGKGGKKKKPTNTTWSYTAGIMLGLAATQIAGTGQCWVDKKKYASVALAGLTVFVGTASQAPWGYLTTYEPTKAVNLRGFAYLAASAYPLSDTASIGNHSVEVFGVYSTVTGSDANICDIIPHLLTTECGFSANKIVVSATLRAECEASGVLFGVALEAQQAANELITELLNLANADAVVKGGVLHIFSRTESLLVTGISLSSDDFIAQQGQPTIKPTRKKTVDCFNVLKLEFLNRANDYNVEIAEAKDEASIADIGTRPAETLKAHSITNATVARNLANQLLHRDLAVRNSYEFSLSMRYIYLEPMDVVMINDLTLGLVNHPVVIKEISITPDFELKISAEDYSSQAYQAVYPPAPSSPNIPDTNAVVGNINTPVIFAAPASLTASGSELWCAVSSSEALYGGCDIYLSIDAGSSYNRIGTHAGSTRMGVLTAGFAAGAEIDAASTLAVNLSQSNGVLSSVSQASVDSLATLCLVNAEFIAYRDVTLTSLSHYSLSYFRRGLYGSTQGAVTNDKIVRCDDSLFKFAYNPQYAGKAIKLKFPAYNIYDAGDQDLSTVPAYDFVIPGVIWDSGSSLWDSGTSLWSNS